MKRRLDSRSSTSQIMDSLASISENANPLFANVSKSDSGSDMMSGDSDKEDLDMGDESHIAFWQAIRSQDPNQVEAAMQNNFRLLSMRLDPQFIWDMVELNYWHPVVANLIFGYHGGLKCEFENLETQGRLIFHAIERSMNGNTDPKVVQQLSDYFPYACRPEDISGWIADPAWQVEGVPPNKLTAIIERIKAEKPALMPVMVKLQQNKNHVQQQQEQLRREVQQVDDSGSATKYMRLGPH